MSAAFTCRECGESERPRSWSNGAELERAALCHRCHYWHGAIALADDPRSVRLDGVQPLIDARDDGLDLLQASLRAPEVPHSPLSGPDQIGTYLDGAEHRQSDVLGLVQLLIAYQMLRASAGAH